MEGNFISTETYFLQQHGRCRTYLHAYNLKRKNEDLHQLRVSIKKIKALLKMLKNLQPELSFKKNFAPYKDIFGHLGPLRDELLQKEKLKNDPQHKPLKEPRPGVISLLRKELKIASPAYLKKIETVLPEILTALRALDPEAIYPYCKKLIDRLHKQWRDADSDVALHGFRKRLKQILYCVKLLPKEERDRLLSSKKMKRLNKLQDTIGTWHDDALLLNRISKGSAKASAPFKHTLKTETKKLASKARKSGDKL